MERRPDRELPKAESHRWARTLPLFAAAIAAASVAIFNYQKLSSPVVASALYALRTSPRAREHLGDEIYFRRAVPWVAGTLNQPRGVIDVRFGVRGTRAAAVMRFASRRPTPRGVFETTEWSLETEDGRVIDLLDDYDDGEDPLRGVAVAGAGAGAGAGAERQQQQEEEKKEEEAASAAAAAAATAAAAAAATTRGFRQQVK